MGRERWEAPAAFEDAWDGYEEELDALNRSAKTVESNRVGWELFVRFVVEERGRERIKDLRRKDVTAWVAHMRRTTKWTDGTLSVRYRGCKAMFTWWARQKERRVSPFTGAVAPKEVPKVVPLLNEALLNNMIASCAVTSDDKGWPLLQQLRDEAIIRTFFDGGPRLGEVQGMFEEDKPDKGGDLIHIRKSKTKTRTNVISRKTRRAVHRYCSERDRYLADRDLDTDALWISRFGKPLTESGIYQIIRRRSGGKINPHWLRHNYANRYLLDGGDPSTMDTSMGWKPGSPMRHRYTAFTEELRAQKNQRAVKVGDRLR